MYEIPIPEGCSVFYGTYIDTYRNNQRTRYYIYGNRLVPSTTSSYTTIPTGSVCLSQGDLVYKPELEVWFSLASLFIFIGIVCVAVRLLIFPFFRRVR